MTSDVELRAGVVVEVGLQSAAQLCPRVGVGCEEPTVHLATGARLAAGRVIHLESIGVSVMFASR